MKVLLLYLQGAFALYESNNLNSPSVVDAILREDNVDQIAQQAASIFPNDNSKYVNNQDIIPPLVGQQLDNAILNAEPIGFNSILDTPRDVEPRIVIISIHSKICTIANLKFELL